MTINNFYLLYSFVIILTSFSEQIINLLEVERKTHRASAAVFNCSDLKLINSKFVHPLNILVITVMLDVSKLDKSNELNFWQP